MEIDVHISGNTYTVRSIDLSFSTLLTREAPYARQDLLYWRDTYRTADYGAMLCQRLRQYHPGTRLVSISPYDASISYGGLFQGDSDTRGELKRRVEDVLVSATPWVFRRKGKSWEYRFGSRLFTGAGAFRAVPKSNLSHEYSLYLSDAILNRLTPSWLPTTRKIWPRCNRKAYTLQPFFATSERKAVRARMGSY